MDKKVMKTRIKRSLNSVKNLRSLLYFFLAGIIIIGGISAYLYESVIIFIATVFLTIFGFAIVDLIGNLFNQMIQMLLDISEIEYEVNNHENPQ